MINRQVVLCSRPVGIPGPEHFELKQTATAALEGGQFLVENIYLSVDPAQRGYVNDENNYSPPVALGDVMRAMTVGRIVESKHPDHKVGDYLYGWFGWQDYCVATPELILRKVDPKQAPLSFGAGLLGINGLTAYMALHDIGKPKAGETVVVTAAAGAVGSLVGQLAKHAGCRTVAVTSSDAKGQQCIDDYGFDAYINYKESLTEGLKKTCPDGVDIYFDNVSGEISDTLYGHMNLFGRVIQCGTVAIPSWVPTPVGPRHDRDILTRRLTVSGFVIFDHAARFDEVAKELAALWKAGNLRVDEDIETAIENAPQALVDVYSGKNKGKKLIQLRNPA